MNEKTLRAVIWTRAACALQSGSSALVLQRTICEEKAKALGAEVVGVFEHIGAVGERNRLCVPLREALALIRKGEAQTILCTDPSRLGPNELWINRVKRRVQFAGGTIYYCAGINRQMEPLRELQRLFARKAKEKAKRERYTEGNQ